MQVNRENKYKTQNVTLPNEIFEIEHSELEMLELYI